MTGAFEWAQVSPGGRVLVSTREAIAAIRKRMERLQPVVLLWQDSQHEQASAWADVCPLDDSTVALAPIRGTKGIPGGVFQARVVFTVPHSSTVMEIAGTASREELPPLHTGLTKALSMGSHGGPWSRDVGLSEAVRMVVDGARECAIGACPPSHLAELGLRVPFSLPFTDAASLDTASRLLEETLYDPCWIDHDESQQQVRLKLWEVDAGICRHGMCAAVPWELEINSVVSLRVRDETALGMVDFWGMTYTSRSQVMRFRRRPRFGLTTWRYPLVELRVAGLEGAVRSCGQATWAWAESDRARSR